MSSRVLTESLEGCSPSKQEKGPYWEETLTLDPANRWAAACPWRTPILCLSPYLQTHILGSQAFQKAWNNPGFLLGP
jgi:hypothetical protein